MAAGRHTQETGGSFDEQLERAAAVLREGKALERLWRRDASLWTGTDEGGLLGWLDLPARSSELLPALGAFAAEARAEGIDRVVVLGMGGSSLGAEALVRCGPRRADGAPELVLLDSTDPERVAEVEASLRGHRPLFLAASKSGGTLETALLQRYFLPRFTARSFVGLTDPGTSLETEAGARGFRAVFHGEPDVGGRFSVLSVFGLLPALLCGVAIEDVLKAASRARDEVFSGGPEAVRVERLAAFVGAAFLSRRDKLTVIAPPRLRAFGWWWEQLVAESLGKSGRGVVPVLEEPLDAAARSGEDRAWLRLGELGLEEQRLEGDDVDAAASGAHRIVPGHDPVLGHIFEHAFESGAGLGAELYRWEVAIALAGHLLQVDPFDQPDVEAAKVATRRYVDKLRRGESLPGPAPATLGLVQLSGFAAGAGARAETGLPALDQLLTAAARPGAYVAFLAYLPEKPEVERGLAALRALLLERLGVATCVGFGPRYLHSTGQLHKGGPRIGAFVILTAERAPGPQVPDERFGFREVQLAQALGDGEALASRGLPVLLAHLRGPLGDALAQLRQVFYDRLGEPLG